MKPKTVLARFLPRGLFAKLLTVFLIIGLVPFLGTGLYTYYQARARMTEAVIEHWLVRLARESAVQLDLEVRRMSNLVEGWAQSESVARDMTAFARGTGNGGDDPRTHLTQNVHSWLRTHRNVDLVLLLGSECEVVADGLRVENGDPRSSLIGQRIKRLLAAEEPLERTWIGQACKGTDRVTSRDWHLSPLVYAARGEKRPEWEDRPRTPDAYAIGMATTIKNPDSQEPVGAIVVIFNWARIHDLLDDIRRRFEEPDDPNEDDQLGRYRSGYPFLFAKDADTVIGHRYLELLGNSLVGNHGLKQLRDKMKAARYGSDQYDYPAGNPKIAGFAHCAPEGTTGFGWIVCVGVDGTDIYADVMGLRGVLVIASIIVTALVIIASAVLSHRVTEPILRLQSHTQQVAQGDLDARVEIDTRDEIEGLADSFNDMAANLKEVNRRLIQAEKDAAWSEMARQVAHEIKNPLTPIMLSAQQLKKAHDDHHPAFNEILRETTETIIGQCVTLKQIASDFMTYASLHAGAKEPEDLAEVIEGAVKPYQLDASHAPVEIKIELATPPRHPGARRQDRDQPRLPQRLQQRTRGHGPRARAHLHHRQAGRGRRRAFRAHRDPRHRSRHPRRAPRPPLRAVLQHPHRRHRSRPRDLPQDHLGARRQDRDRQRPRRGNGGGADAARGGERRDR